MSPCGWTITQCGCGACWDTYTPAVQASASALATTIMWAATGRQFGKCSITVQPCQRAELLPEYQTWPVSFDGYTQGPYIAGGVWHNSCPSSGDACSCDPGKCGVVLQGPTTTADITQVVVAGAIVNPAAYIVVDGHTLLRVDGICWPTCSDVTNQLTPDFEVTYNVGLPIPLAVQTATERLACEYAKACAGAPCALPLNMRSLTRQGVEVQITDIPASSLEDKRGIIRTGIREVDMVIAIFNPHSSTRRPSVLSMDLPAPRRM
jgi:hypothetical protein